MQRSRILSRAKESNQLVCKWLRSLRSVAIRCVLINSLMMSDSEQDWSHAGQHRCRHSKTCTAAKCQGIPRCMMGRGWNGVKCHCGCCASINNQKRRKQKRGRVIREDLLPDWGLCLFCSARCWPSLPLFHIQLLTSQNLLGPLNLNYHAWNINPMKDPTPNFTSSTPGVGCTCWIYR